MENSDVLRLVVSFIGSKYYRFIAVISQSFHTAYTQEFPKDKETELNASTVEYAKICWEDSKNLTTEQHCELSSSAAFFGSLPAMQYLRSVRCEWDEQTCSHAAENGHLNVLKYARENGCPWDETTCAGAAGNGHLNVLKYARENDCPWNEQTCAYAAENGHFNIFKFARENGCP